MSEHSTTQAVEFQKTAQNTTENEAGISRSLTILCAATVGLVVGNLYYAQPLLAVIAQDLGLTEAQVGGAASLGMLAQTFGMLFLLPLGDVYNRRPFILASVAASVLALLAVSFSDGIVWFSLACFALGISTFGTHMTISLAASLAHPQKRGQVVGTVFGGLLTGLLLSRTISGVLGSAWGWRPVYYVGASVLTILFFLLWVKLPNSIPQSQMSYPRLLWSMVTLLRTQPVLRLSCAYGAAAFASFNAFWVTLAFHLERPPLEQGSEVVGMLGLLGVVGALIAGPVGKLADTYGPQRILATSMLLTFVSFAIFGIGGYSMWALSFGVIVMDLGIQAIQVSNQAQIYSLIPEARNRLGTIYIVIYFLGGTIGSAVGVWAWSRFGWIGVCTSGGFFMGLALLVYLGQWLYGRVKEEN
ncbi:MFS transporter [Blastopirellula marina]|uniref:MFS transporter n=1 Tax=Blastopirellula marina TaxID=124 RepID=A0A2S8F870_9BACT|nr:MFS transporter [Blastopirellula marina]PQO28358.1 MFS transporter [Blastopirellula marina]PTL41898.1 MFS transporter [Blastopirellula marina]